ncbi:MAG TPA: SBBP repeat-containing protein [Flavobacteriales bacterium]|nr:SBBP repeat-containing protein [Flavobacteriales bacterium]HPH81501.1 SBBP repeat-containing protein [Flavobacteriales bacterium]
MKKHLLFFLLICIKSVYAQNPNFSFVKSIGGTGNELGYATTVDASGNILTAGLFSGTTDFDPGPGTTNLTSIEYGDGFITKMDANGNFLWAYQIGGLGNDYINGIATDANGNVYATGQTGTSDLLIYKLNSSGNIQWSMTFGSPGGTEGGNGIEVDDLGNVYVVGECMGTIDFDRGAGIANLVSAGSSDVFVAKYDADGNYIWAKRMGGIDSEYGKSIAIDANFNVFTTGYWSNTADFDPGAGTFNMTTNGSPNDAFISKLDASGNFVFAKQFAGASHTYSHCIDLDPAGNIYTTGYFGGTIDFDPGAGTYNLSTTLGGDIFVSKLDGNGNFVWAKAIIDNTTGNDIGNSIVVDDAQNVYFTGVFAGTADFDPGVGVFNITASAITDAYACKLDINGNFGWAISWGGSSGDEARSIEIDNNQNLYFTGYFVNTVDFDPGTGVTNVVSNNASADAYLLKLSDCTLLNAPSAISGNTAICSASSNTYSVPAVSGATSYTWTLPSGWSGTSTTNSITTTSNSTSGDITVSANNSCGPSAATTLAVSVETQPSAPGAITGPANLCESSNQTYSIVSVSGATNYVWNLPNGWTGTSNSISIDALAGLTGGNITVQAENACGISSSQSFTVVVNPLPAVSLNLSPNLLCVNTSATALNGGLPAGGIFSGNGINATEFEPSLAGLGTHTITYTYTDSNSCISYATDNIVVDACLGIKEMINVNEIELFPSPTSGEFTIQCDEFSNHLGTITIYNILGEVIYSNQTQSSQIHIDISQFSNGIYYAKIEIGNRIRVIELMKY